ncbi:MAG TPA: ABC transporter permease [Candidatus Acidoferrales bacterium]|nr:ABC transporter permease [Candidatus Acidoferrales bacterium]
MNTLLQDLRYGLRMLAKAPTFTAIAVITLALGIGANTAIFSAVNGILLKPLPYAEPSQLVDLMGVKYFPGGIEGSVLVPADVWQKVRAQTPAIAQMALWNRDGQTITGDAAPELVSAARVSSDFFPLLGTRPVAGRPILPGDTQPGAKPVAVISYALWRTRFGGAADVLSHVINLDSRPYQIVGVMPARFTYPIETVEKGGEGIWLPLIVSPGKKGAADTYGYVIARLKKGVSLAAANAQLETVSARMSSVFPGWMAGAQFRAFPLEKHFGDLDKALLILLGAVGFVLLIACVNVSALLLSRGWARQREVAIREALGASRLRIVRQFLTESVLLALGGGALGLLFSFWGVRVLRAVTPTDLPEYGHLLLNANILWFTFGVSLLTGILFGLAPALQAAGRRVGGGIREGISGSLAGSLSRRPRRLRSGLVVFEIALAVILVIGATLVARSFSKLTAVKLGFRTDHIITMDANFSKSVCDRSNPKMLAGCKAATFDALKRMRSISGVQRAAVASWVPLTDWSLAVELKIEGQQGKISLSSGEVVGNHVVSPGYFQTLGIPLLSGRGFTDADTAGSQLVVIVDEAFAKKYLGKNPLGRRISTDMNKKWMQVVGIVATARDTDLSKRPEGEIYLPYAQVDHFQAANFIARTSANPAVMIPALRRAIWSEDKDAPITDVQTMEQIVSSSVAEQRYQTLLLGSFGGLGLILAMVGIYGVISYGVTQRTREIGVRMALGAQPANVLRMVIREGMFLAGGGILVGIGGALALGRVLQSLLFEIKPSDPATFVGVSIALGLVALAACYIPARRAMRVDPMVALRYE